MLFDLYFLVGFITELYVLVPIRLTEENIVNDVPTLLLTYDLHNIKLGPQVASLLL
jgi:hypothetical protein